MVDVLKVHTSTYELSVSYRYTGSRSLSYRIFLRVVKTSFFQSRKIRISRCRIRYATVCLPNLTFIDVHLNRVTSTTFI